ncbi:hypothetical protein HID58_021218 [Brassica napus]|uniref:Uncharacterized protein n=1 Tax=Brassica napus TaxID=3708 RepID=A0ABQ8CVT1_BRANA|nr:hypothetical protein HID58_021218 [Brassica napus]
MIKGSPLKIKNSKPIVTDASFMPLLLPIPPSPPPPQLWPRRQRNARGRLSCVGSLEREEGPQTTTRRLETVKFLRLLGVEFPLNRFLSLDFRFEKHFSPRMFSPTLLQQVVNLTAEQQYEVLKLQQALKQDPMVQPYSTGLRCFSYIFFLLCDLILARFPPSSIQGTSNWVGRFHLTETCSNEHGFSHSNYQKKKKKLLSQIYTAGKHSLMF